jgi:hypothetical protein
MLMIRMLEQRDEVAVAVIHVMYYPILPLTLILCFTFSLAFVQDQYHEGFPHPR